MDFDLELDPEVEFEALERLPAEQHLTGGGEPCGVTCMIDTRCNDTIRPHT